MSEVKSGRRKSEYIPELDGARGVFMAAIFLFHCAPKTGVSFLDIFIGSLWPSIDLFFALSGFLITSSLLDDQDNRYRVRNFYINRVLRIFPAYYAAIFFVFVLFTANESVAQRMENGPGALWFLTYSFNFWIALNDGWPASGVMNHFWSLCVEEQFYFIWPMIIYLLYGTAQRNVIISAFVIAAVAELCLILTEAHWSVFHTNIFTRIDSLAAGALLAFLHRSKWRLSIVPTMSKLFYLSLAVLLVCAIAKGGLRFAGLHAHLIVQPVLVIWSAALIYLLINGGASFKYMAALFRLPIFKWLGKYSYGVYIWHWILFAVVVELDAFGWRTGYDWLNFALVVALTLTVALVSYHGLEKWFLRLKARKFVSRHAPSGSSAVG